LKKKKKNRKGGVVVMVKIIDVTQYYFVIGVNVVSDETFVDKLTGAELQHRLNDGNWYSRILKTMPPLSDPEMWPVGSVVIIKGGVYVPEVVDPKIQYKVI